MLGRSAPPLAKFCNQPFIAKPAIIVTVRQLAGKHRQWGLVTALLSLPLNMWNKIVH